MVDGVCDGFGDIFRLVHKCQLPMVHGADPRHVSWIQFCLQCCHTGFHKSHVAFTPVSEWVSERVTDTFRFSIFMSYCLRMFGCIWGMSAGCLRDVWGVSGVCLESGWGLSRGCLEGCLEDVIMLSFQSFLPIIPILPIPPILQSFQSFQSFQSY